MHKGSQFLAPDVCARLDGGVMAMDRGANPVREVHRRINFRHAGEKAGEPRQFGVESPGFGAALEEPLDLLAVSIRHRTVHVSVQQISVFCVHEFTLPLFS
jgi:hypothetical protein